MKTIKNDTRYIIKRILIGVGIALILGFIGKKGVFAEDLPKLYIDIFGYSHPEITNIPFNSHPNIVYDFNYSNYNININKLSNTSFYYILFKDSNNYYLLTSNTFDSFCSTSPTFDSLNFTNSTIQLNNNNDLVCNLSSPGFTEIRILSQNNISNNNFYNDLITNNYFSSNYDNNYNNDFNYSVLIQNTTVSESNRFLGIYNALSYMKNNFEFVSSSVPIYIDNLQISIPNYFQEIDLTNYQAVYFVPKDYVLVPSFIKDSKEYLHFNYYLFGSVNSGYFNIENTNDDFNFNSDENLVSFSDFTYIESSFPLYFKDDDLSAFMLFNTGNETKIKYDSRYYNYYFVSDLSDYSNEVQFIDENGQEVSRYISFTAILEDYWLKGFSSGGDNFINDSCSDGGICADHITGYIDFLKMPFSFLRNLSKDKCIPISIPIPFVNGNISINCLSSLFQNILGDFYDILLYIITGLYAYRITILNIDTITDVLNPSDDKLEVVDL